MNNNLSQTAIEYLNNKAIKWKEKQDKKKQKELKESTFSTDKLYKEALNKLHLHIESNVKYHLSQHRKLFSNNTNELQPIIVGGGGGSGEIIISPFYFYNGYMAGNSGAGGGIKSNQLMAIVANGSNKSKF